MAFSASRFESMTQIAERVGILQIDVTLAVGYIASAAVGPARVGQPYLI